MIDYLSFKPDQLRRVMHPTRRVAMGCPEPLLTRYYRSPAERKRAGEKNVQGAWFLDGSDPAWLDLIPIADALKVYETGAVSPKLAPLQRAREERKQRLLVYWSAVRALPGGDDPLWRYASDGDDVAPDDDQRFVVFNNTEPNKPPWFPRLQLRIRYGTTSLREYARRQGVEYPIA